LRVKLTQGASLMEYAIESQKRCIFIFILFIFSHSIAL